MQVIPQKYELWGRPINKQLENCKSTGQIKYIHTVAFEEHKRLAVC